MKTLTWRLKDKPTFDEVESLLDKKVINKDEARQILFGNEKTEELKALKEKVEFLEGLVDTLSKNRGHTTITYPRYYEARPWWNDWTYATPIFGDNSITLTAGTAFTTSGAIGAGNDSSVTIT